MLKTARLHIVAVAVFALPLLFAICGADARASPNEHSELHTKASQAFVESIKDAGDDPWENNQGVKVVVTEDRDVIVPEYADVGYGAMQTGKKSWVNDGYFPGTQIDIFGKPDGWYKAPNICGEKEIVSGSDYPIIIGPAIVEEMLKNGLRYHVSKCHDTGIKFKCILRIKSKSVDRTYLVKYSCCRGLRRRIGTPFCSGESVKPIIETLKYLGVSGYTELARTHNLSRKLECENITVFAPIDQAVLQFAENQVKFDLEPADSKTDTYHTAEITDDTWKQLVLRHIVKGIHDVDDLVNNQVLYSDDRNLRLRFNVYNGYQNRYRELGTRVMAVNCAELMVINHIAVNGYVHAIDRVTRPATKSIGQIITDSDQFSKFRQLLEDAELLNYLKQPGNLTVFTPTNQAFDKLEYSLHRWLCASSSCARRIVEYHILNHLLCSCAVKYRMRVVTLMGLTLVVDRSVNDDFLVHSRTKVVVSDVMATNGVIHVIEEVLLHSSALPITTVLRQMHLTQFANLIEETGLKEVFETEFNWTLFVPTNNGLSRTKFITAIEEARKNPEELRNLVLFHSTKGQVLVSDMRNHKEVKSGFEGHNITFNYYSNQSTVQCANLMNIQGAACGGRIYQVDGLLIPPKLTALQYLESNENFTTFLAFMKQANILSELKENSSFTILAVPNIAFDILSKMQTQAILNDENRMRETLRKHVLPEVVCCDSLRPGRWPYPKHVRSLGGPLSLHSDYNENTYITDSKITACDYVATDGVVHIINKVILPMEISAFGMGVKNPDADVFLFGL